MPFHAATHFQLILGQYQKAMVIGIHFYLKFPADYPLVLG